MPGEAAGPGQEVQSLAGVSFRVGGSCAKRHFPAVEPTAAAMALRGRQARPPLTDVGAVCERIVDPGFVLSITLIAISPLNGQSASGQIEQGKDQLQLVTRTRAA